MDNDEKEPTKQPQKELVVSPRRIGRFPSNERQMTFGPSTAFCPFAGRMHLPESWTDFPFVDQDIDFEMVRWSDHDKCYTVQIVYRGKNPFDVLSYLTIHVASESRCSCGSTLVLKDHGFRTGPDGLKFDGLYVCETCNITQQTLLHGLKKYLGEIWKSGRRVTIGPAGLTYEKESGRTKE